MSNTLQVSAPSLLRVHDSGRSRKNASSVVGVRARRATVSCKSCSMVILHLRPPATIADRGFHYRKRRDHTGEVRDSAAILARPIWRLSRRSEEHTSELQSRLHLVCRLLL